MSTTISSYEQQALDFLASFGGEFKATFVKHDKHFQDDQETRDIYECVFTRPNKKPLSIRFGQSIAKSGAFIVEDKNPRLTKTFPDKSTAFAYAQKIGVSTFKVKKNKQSLPTAYDVLACLTKNDPRSFNDFCDEYGYDNDSRKAEKIYNSVREEWYKVNGFFTNTELEQLQEIQ